VQGRASCTARTRPPCAQTLTSHHHRHLPGRHNRELKQLLQLSLGRWHACRLSGAFAFWRGYAAYQGQLKTRMGAVVARMRSAALGAALAGWRCATPP
jgi:hypothetical protein